MSPPKLKPVRKPDEFRVTRTRKVEAAHGDSHGWAVSYADLLMVLLSFFVLYFSFAEEDPNKVHEKLQRMALAMKGLPVEPAGADSSRKPQSEAETFADLVKLLSMEGVSLAEKDGKLVVGLQASAYKPGAYSINPGLKKQIDLVMERLIPVKDGLALTVIGHTDQQPMRPRNDLLRDNFDLSSIRALHALKYVLSKGFPETHASARAASHFDRDARSISFEIAMAQVKDSAGVTK